MNLVVGHPQTQIEPLRVSCLPIRRHLVLLLVKIVIRKTMFLISAPLISMFPMGQPKKSSIGLFQQRVSSMGILIRME
jgi:hypothetical protein